MCRTGLGSCIWPVEDRWTVGAWGPAGDTSVGKHAPLHQTWLLRGSAWAKDLESGDPSPSWDSVTQVTLERPWMSPSLCCGPKRLRIPPVVTFHGLLPPSRPTSRARAVSTCPAGCVGDGLQPESFTKTAFLSKSSFKGSFALEGDALSWKRCSNFPPSCSLRPSHTLTHTHTHTGVLHGHKKG